MSLDNCFAYECSAEECSERNQEMAASDASQIKQWVGYLIWHICKIDGKNKRKHRGGDRHTEANRRIPKNPKLPSAEYMMGFILCTSLPNSPPSSSSSSKSSSFNDSPESRAKEIIGLLELKEETTQGDKDRERPHLREPRNKGATRR